MVGNGSKNEGPTNYISKICRLYGEKDTKDLIKNAALNIHIREENKILPFSISKRANKGSKFLKVPVRIWNVDEWIDSSSVYVSLNSKSHLLMDEYVSQRDFNRRILLALCSIIVGLGVIRRSYTEQYHKQVNNSIGGKNEKSSSKQADSFKEDTKADPKNVRPEDQNDGDRAGNDLDRASNQTNNKGAQLAPDEGEILPPALPCVPFNGYPFRIYSQTNWSELLWALQDQEEIQYP